MSDKLWTPAELADEWQVSYEWVRRRLKTGELRALRLSPRGPWRIPDDVVQAFYREHAHDVADAADGGEDALADVELDDDDERDA